MAFDVSNGVPTSFRAGDTVLWTETYPDYDPSDGWGLRYFFTREGREPVEIVATGATPAFSVTLTGADSTQFDAGPWKWHARVELIGTGTKVVGTGKSEVLPDPSRIAPLTYAERGLALLENTVLANMVTAQESVSISGVDITLMSISEREALRGKWKAEIARERRRRRISGGDPAEMGKQVNFYP